MKVVYEGPADIRELSAADLKKRGVEDFTKTRFFKGKAVEVDDKVGEALINEAIFGNFRVAKTKKSAENEESLDGDDELDNVADATGETVSTKSVGGSNGSSTKSPTK